MTDNPPDNWDGTPEETAMEGFERIHDAVANDPEVIGGIVVMVVASRRALEDPEYEQTIRDYCRTLPAMTLNDAIQGLELNEGYACTATQSGTVYWRS